MNQTPEQGISKIKLYSPKQIKFGSFLGGPLAMVYVLKKNFDALGDKTGSRMTVIWGVIFNILLFSSIPFLSKKFPHYVLPIIYALVAEQIAEKYQMTKQAILDSKKYEFQSNGNVLGFSVALCIAFVLIYGLGLYGLIALGLF